MSNERFMASDVPLSYNTHKLKLSRIQRDWIKRNKLHRLKIRFHQNFELLIFFTIKCINNQDISKKACPTKCPIFCLFVTFYAIFAL